MPSIKENVRLVPGFHGVREALSQRESRVQELWILEGKDSARVREIAGLAKERNISVRFKDESTFFRHFPNVVHQGVAALIEGFEYADLDRVIATSLHGPGRGLLVVADHITDEGNLGALIRTTAFFGAGGLIIPKDRSAAVSSRVLKLSSGGYLHLPVVRVVNLARTLDLLEKGGFWIIGAAGEAAESIYGFDWDRDVVLALGNEERGLTQAVRTRCHQLVRIEKWGRMESLNVSVAGGVILSEILRQRRFREKA
jgi:23S rRNA (guanosine2251-2'-O)-methyltransferase